MKRNYIILTLCSAFVLIATILNHFAPARVVQDEKPTATSTPHAANMTHDKTYTNHVQGFSIGYQAGMKVDETYKYDNLQSGKSIAGVSFAFAPTFSQGTNLSSDSHVAVEWKNTEACAPKEFTDEPLRDILVRSINGNDWRVASTSGAGAGNLYEEVLHTRKVGAMCFNVRLFLHSSNIGNYDPGTVRAFDRKSVDAILNEMLSSFQDSATAIPL